MTIYFDYNLLERLVDQRSGIIGHSNDTRWHNDHQAIAQIYEQFELGRLVLIICKFDGLEEFRAYMPDKIKNYDDILQLLPERMKPKYQLFVSLQ